MITTTNVNLKVPFNEKDQAKSLGARWNAEAKVWYVPQGVDAAPFEKWLSSAPSSNFNNAPNVTLSTTAANSAAKTKTKPITQINSGINTPFTDDLDAINASLRDAYESNEDAVGF